VVEGGEMHEGHEDIFAEDDDGIVFWDNMLYRL
jgi:hypothetical protein